MCPFHDQSWYKLNIFYICQYINYSPDLVLPFQKYLNFLYLQVGE